MTETETIFEKFLDWLREERFSNPIISWARPRNVQKAPENKSVELYFEIPMNPLGSFLESLRYSYGLVEDSEVEKYLGRDLNAVVVATDSADKGALESVRSFNEENWGGILYWKSRGVVVYELENGRVHSPGITREALFANFIDSLET